MDGQGNAFSCTPSDGVMRNTPAVPGTGLYPSGRGNQSWTEPDHPSCIAPGKRPRLTPNSALAIREGAEVMPFGIPGGDQQTQALGDDLAARGHKVEWWAEDDWLPSGACAVAKDLKTGVLWGGADRRRTCYALGW
jgi:gamma-glutamyltranspeptidase/glutathione hydrolase